MHLVNKPTNSLFSKHEILRVVLDEPRLFTEESLGSAMVRGEVIVNFPKDTQIQGPIELLFEGTQRFHTWQEIMRHSPLGKPIETKLHVIELSLLPPNSKGIMPAGVQRFPFEFPIPAVLPTTVFIANRIEIFYQLSASIHRSSLSENHESANPLNWLDWARRNSLKKKYTACKTMRIVRSMESIITSGLPAPINSNVQLTTSAAVTHNVSLHETFLNTAPPSSDSTSTAEVSDSNLPWNHRRLDGYQTTMDEQHDHLAFSLSGRTIENLNRPAQSLEHVCGIRYKLSVDRTAIAIGTSVGIELMIEPTFSKALIKSATLNISETRKYVMKVPSDYNRTNAAPETKRHNERAKMILKWANGYQFDNNEKCRPIGDQSKLYVRKRLETDKIFAYFDPPQPGNPNSKLFIDKAGSTSTDSKPITKLDNEEFVVEDSAYPYASTTSGNTGMINLKELNQLVQVGEYFGGRFVLPVPSCSSILHPSMEYESITISHWIHLVVTIECEGKSFDLTLDSPCRLLDCRVVADDDDDSQTILPPPPSYRPGDGHLRKTNRRTSTFWEQREPITSITGWGACLPCPCQLKEMKKKLGSSVTSSSNTKKRASTGKTSPRANNGCEQQVEEVAIGSCPPSLQPEWGPPPSYSEN